jgi:hypothetical protein
MLRTKVQETAKADRAGGNVVAQAQGNVKARGVGKSIPEAERVAIRIGGGRRTPPPQETGKKRAGVGRPEFSREEERDGCYRRGAPVNGDLTPIVDFSSPAALRAGAEVNGRGLTRHLFAVARKARP